MATWLCRPTRSPRLFKSSGPPNVALACLRAPLSPSWLVHVAVDSMSVATELSSGRGWSVGERGYLYMAPN